MENLEPGYLDITQAAEFLRISTGSLYHLLCKRLIRNYKIGRRVVFRPEDLREYVEREGNLRKAKWEKEA